MKHHCDTIVIGENAHDNWKLIDTFTNPKFTWLHLKSFPSAHVMIFDENPSQQLLIEAANLCKQYSKYKSMKNIKVSYTLRSNIQKDDQEPGSVIFRSNKKVYDIKVV